MDEANAVELIAQVLLEAENGFRGFKDCTPHDQRRYAARKVLQALNLAQAEL